MKRGLMALVMGLVALVFTSCELLLENPDRVITQGEIAGNWDYVYSDSWEYGTISIDQYGNFTKELEGFGVKPILPDQYIGLPTITTGTIIIAGGKATVTIDGKSTTHKIEASKRVKNRWLLDSDGDMAYMAFGNCDDLGMFGAGEW